MDIKENEGGPQSLEDMAAQEAPGGNLRLATSELESEELEGAVAAMTAILEATTDGILVVDRDDKVTNFNKAFAELWGLPKGQAVSNHHEVTRLLSAKVKDPESYLARIAEICEASEEAVDELLLSDGRVLERTTRIQIIGGKVFGRVWGYRDVTQMRRVHEVKSYLAAIVGDSEDAIVSKTLDGVVTTWNSAAERMFGYTAEEMIGRELAIIIPSDQSLNEPEILARIRRGDRIDHYETERLRKDGSRINVSITVSPIRDAKGRIIGASKIARDITNQKAIERALRDSETQLRATFEQAAVGIAIADIEGRFARVNDRFSAILGYGRDELLKLSFWDVIHPEDLPTTEAETGRLLRGESNDFRVEERYLTKAQQPLWCLTSLTLLRDADGVPLRFVAVIEDISDRKRADDERHFLLESERAARMEAEKLGRLKDEFLATLSHELRTPLTSILGWSHLIRADVSNSDRVREGIEIIERNARVQTDLVADLLDMNRIISGKMRLDVQMVELPTVIRSAIESMRPAAEAKGLKIETILDPVTEIINGDPARLQQVVWNLVSNAVKFTPKGGKVQVTLHRVGSCVEIAVSDTGKGIDPDFLPHIFERFRQEDASSAREHGGLGIGLAIAKQLIDLHGGRIRAASKGEGEGATFVVELPISAMYLSRELGDEEEHPSATKASRVEFDVPDLTGLNVLVIDDEPDARALLRMFLEDRGAQVWTAANAAECLAILAERTPDVLVSDIGMPSVDGYALIREVRKMSLTIPAAALTAFARSEDRTRAFLAGYNAHIPKPVEPYELLVTVASLANRRA